MDSYKGFLVILKEDEKFTIFNTHSGKIVKPYIGDDGYMHVTRRENKRMIRERVHRIIANIFIDNPENLKYVNHINSNKLDNRISNLEWCSNSHNVKHGWDSGHRTHKNNTHVSAYINNELVGTWSSIRKMCEELHVDRHKVSNILKGTKKNNYNYEFRYASQTTIESVA